jgi:hypothetical protein
VESNGEVMISRWGQHIKEEFGIWIEKAPKEEISFFFPLPKE